MDWTYLPATILYKPTFTVPRLLFLLHLGRIRGSNYLSTPHKIMCTLRSSPGTIQSHSFFQKFSGLNFVKSIRPGNRIGDPVVTDIKALMYTPDGEIHYKLKFYEEYLPDPRARPEKDSTPQAHTSRLPIKSFKIRHLQELKSVIPQEFHSYFDNLPYN